MSKQYLVFLLELNAPLLLRQGTDKTSFMSKDFNVALRKIDPTMSKRKAWKKVGRALDKCVESGLIRPIQDASGSLKSRYYKELTTEGLLVVEQLRHFYEKNNTSKDSVRNQG